MHSVAPVQPLTFDPRRIGAIKHNYHTHPLMQLDALAALARRLMPRGNCRFIKPGTKLDSPFDHDAKPHDQRDLDEVLENIDEPGSWIALYDAQVDKIYADFLAEVKGGIQALVQPDQRIDDIRAFFFLSAPPSVTPFHIDRENNFWLQIRGRKNITVFDHRDREVVPAKVVEKFILAGGLDGVRLRPEDLERGQRFECGPGDGVYFPSTTPHMTESRPEWPGADKLSISVGMVFYTNITRRHARVYMMNQFLRRLGVEPREPGVADRMDVVKAIAGRGLWAIQNGLNKLKPRKQPRA
jgi:hypothetical protein